MLLPYLAPRMRWYTYFALFNSFYVWAFAFSVYFCTYTIMRWRGKFIDGKRQFDNTCYETFDTLCVVPVGRLYKSYGTNQER